MTVPQRLNDNETMVQWLRLLVVMPPVLSSNPADDSIKILNTPFQSALGAHVAASGLATWRFVTGHKQNIPQNILWNIPRNIPRIFCGIFFF